VGFEYLILSMVSVPWFVLRLHMEAYRRGQGFYGKKTC
jgi:hypothetical protein